MSLASLQEILKKAHENKYAIGSFNVFNFETISAVIEVAEETKSPVILGLPERLLNFIDADLLSSSIVSAAEKSTVPTSVHLDHGQSYKGIMKAIRWGFNSVMYDGSNLPYDENLQRMTYIAKMAHAIDINVEGVIGKNEDYTLDKILNFVDKTKIDSLSIDLENPIFTEEFLMKINENIGIPLVMHGNKNKEERFNPEYYRPYIDLGVNKINVVTDMSNIAARTLKEELPKNENANYVTVMNYVKKAVKESVTKYVLAFGSVSKA